MAERQDDNEHATDNDSAEEQLRIVIPPDSELRIKYASFFELSRQEKNRIERQEPEGFRNGKYGVVIEGGADGQEVTLSAEEIGTAILFHLDKVGRLTHSEQIFP